MNWQFESITKKGAPLAFVLYCFFCILFVWKIQQVGMTFPIPWPDESAFLWQSIAFQEFNHLFAPQLDSSRDIMWMPPGYMILTGMIFKVTGFSLEIARSISAAFVVLSVACLVLAFVRHRASLWIVLLFGLGLLSSGFILAGNTARMEAPLMLTSFAGMLLISRGYWYPGIFLVLISPLIHPNGLHFCLVAGCFLLIQLWRHDKSLIPKRLDYLYMALLLAAWAAYAAYVALNWEWFIIDMQGQVDLKTRVLKIAGHNLDRVTLFHNISLLLALLMSLFFQTTPQTRLLQLLGFSLLSLNFFSTALTYRVFEVSAVLVATALLLVVFSSLGDRSGWSKLKTNCGMALIFVFAYAIMINNKYIELSLLSPASLQVGELSVSPDTEWITPKARHAVARYLRELDESSKQPLQVVFIPVADSLLFREQESEGIRFMARIYEKTPPDIAIFHISPATPQFLGHLQAGYLVTLVGSSDFFDKGQVLYSDTKGTRWEFFDFRGIGAEDE